MQELHSKPHSSARFKFMISLLVFAAVAAWSHLQLPVSYRFEDQQASEAVGGGGRQGHFVFVKYRNGVCPDERTAKYRRWKAWPADVGDSDWEIVD